MPSEETRWLREAHHELRDAGGLFVVPTPANYDQTVPKLEKAAASLQRVVEGLQAGGAASAEALAEAEAVRQELLRIGAVLHYAAAYHAALGRLLAAMSSGYGPAGDPQPAAAEPRLSVHA